MKLDVIAFDADDTLWENEALYRSAQENFIKLLQTWEDSKQIEQTLDETEMRNLPRYGYGIKAFALSMIETALEISKGKIPGAHIGEILTIARSMLEAEVRVFPGVEETLSVLSKAYRLMIITKGDILDQTSKVARSGLADYFSTVEVLAQKTPWAYSSLLKKYSLSPKRFMMVGNSLRSDILPVLKIGGTAVHIPAATTWTHETVSEFDHSRDNFFQIQQIKMLPTLIKQH